MVNCPKCGRESTHVRTLYADAIDDIVEVQCQKCGIQTATITPPWVAA
jgi:transcription elongation factor Elf1